MLLFLILALILGSNIRFKYLNLGEVAERLKAHAWKACKGEILSWVRIPFSPPLKYPHTTNKSLKLNTRIK